MTARKSRRRRWPWVAAALVLALSAGAFARSRAADSGQFDAALVVPVKRGDLAIEVIETGKVQPREKVEIKSKVAGQVTEVLVQEGQKVDKGQPLLRIDPTDFERDVARAKADVARAHAEIEQARNAIAFATLGLDRRKKGIATRSVAQADVDLAEHELRLRSVALRTAQSTLAGLQVALSAAQDRLRYTQIEAPLQGTVIELGIRVGEVVTPGVEATFEGKALLTVADLSTLIVKADLNQIDVAKVGLGQKVSLTLDALPGKAYAGSITKVAPASVTPKGKEVDVFPVEATLDSADGVIKPGMTADARIHVEHRANVLSLPIEAVVKEQGKSYVTKVVADERGRRTGQKVEVAIGARNDRAIEIHKGLAAGDQVLIKPASAEDNEFKM